MLYRVNYRKIRPPLPSLIVVIFNLASSGSFLTDNIKTMRSFIGLPEILLTLSTITLQDFEVLFFFMLCHAKGASPYRSMNAEYASIKSSFD